MTSLKNKIGKPFFFVIVSIPVSIFILFNISVAVYSYQYSKESIEDVTAVLSEHIQDSAQDITATSALQLLRVATSHANTELLVYDRRGTVLDIQDNGESFLTDDIIAKVKEAVSQSDGAVSFFDGFTCYHAIEIHELSSMKLDTVIYVSRGGVADDFIVSINIILLCVIFIVCIIFSLLSKIIAKQVTKPLEDLSHMVSVMDANTLILLPPNNTSIELHILTESINELNQRIHNTIASQKSFLHDTSHELRTPLMSIMGYAQGIEMEVFKDARGTAHLIVNESQRLTKLVDNLLTLARIENFDNCQNLSPTNIGNFLKDLLQSFGGYAMAENITITSTLENNIICLGNDELLNNAVGNILSNAIRYGNSVVNINLSTSNNNCVIIISDDGDGIENPSEIFNRFHKGKNGGFGLGLSIVKMAVTQMNGTVTSENNNGAVLTVTLPITTQKVDETF